MGSFLETTGLPCLTASNSDKPWQIVQSKELLMMPGIKEWNHLRAASVKTRAA